MDEPFGALDAITKRELHAEFRTVQRSLHRTVLLVTHDIAEASALADRIAVLRRGPRDRHGYAGARARSPPIRACARCSATRIER